MPPCPSSRRRLRCLDSHVGCFALASTEIEPDVPQAMIELCKRGFVPVASPVVDAALAELTTDGFTVLPNMIDSRWLQDLRETFETLCAQEGPLGGLETMPPERQTELRAPLEPGYEGEPPFAGIRRLGDLVNKGECFDGIWQNLTLISIVAGVLPGAFKLHSLNGHDPKSGQGEQNLHADWSPPPDLSPREPHLYGVVNSAWCLDDFTIESGATRVVPKSHLRAGSAVAEEADKEAVQVVAAAGSVIVWNGSTWHGGATNTTISTRRAVHCAWLDRRYKQQTNQREHLRVETAKRLLPLHRYLLDVE